MRFFLINNLLWVLVFLSVSYFISNVQVAFFTSRYPEEKIYKYIPAIINFILAVNSACIFIYSADAVLTNLLFMILNVLLLTFSFTGTIFAVGIAAYSDLRVYLKQRNEGENKFDN